ncbi:MAG TPA: hypothetical protein VJT33_17140 [bacterium]|nr:hypothetical protein [bacterium]
MWPYLFGSSWARDTVLSAALVAAVIAGVAVLLAPRGEPSGYADAAYDRTQRIWHAYEQGDLTEWEFARLMSPRHPSYEQRQSPVVVAGPAGETLVPEDIAAD